MFPIRAKTVLPVQHIVLKSVAVRGQLGSLTVWVTNEDEQADANGQFRTRLTPRHWTKVYEQKHAPSQATYQTLEFPQPIILHPGQIRGMYIHSTLGGDEAIVYDNSDPGRSTSRYEDRFLSIHSGKAHLSPTAFGQMPIWGWGNAWRDRREFVGQVNYGAVYQLWNPQVHLEFGPSFREATRSLLGLQRRDGCVMSTLPDECIYYILNMCRWDWFCDSPETIKQEKRRKKYRHVAAAAVQEESDAAEQPVTDLMNHHIAESRAARAQSRGHRRREDSQDSSDDSDADDDVEVDEDESSDDDDVEADEDESSDDDDDDDDESNGSDWERMNGYRADTSAFTYRYYSSDEEEELPEVQAPYFRSVLGAGLLVHRFDRRTIGERLRQLVANGDDEHEA